MNGISELLREGAAEVENACQLPLLPEDDDLPVRVGNCAVTTSFLFDDAPARLAALKAQEAAAVLPINFSSNKTKSQRKNARAKKRKKARALEEQQQQLSATARLSLPGAERPLADFNEEFQRAFAASLGEGEAACHGLLSLPSCDAGAALFARLLPASKALFALDVGGLVEGAGDIQAHGTGAAAGQEQPSAPEGFSLQARSTGLLPRGLPEPAGSHTRWDPDDAAAEEPAAVEAAAIAADVAEHTVGAGAAAAPEQLQIAAGIVAEEVSAVEGERLDSYESLKQADLQKYWLQRYSLWSRFDEGVLMDREGWYSVTPEALARHQAERMACDVVVDAFCGAGGNAVQLARTCGAVLAVDTSPGRLALARHNARVYGVEGRIDFICADFLRLSPRLRADAVFLSPPWGGPGYNVSRGTFDVSRDAASGGLGVGYGELLRAADAALHRPVLTPRDVGETTAAGFDGGRLAAFLPKSSSLAQLGAALPPGMGCEVERNVLNGRLKSVTVYVGEAGRTEPDAWSLARSAAFWHEVDSIAPTD